MASPQWRRGQRSEGHASAKRVRFDLPRVHGQWPGTIRGAEPTAGSSFVVGNYITDKTTLTRLRLHQTHPANDSTPQAAQNLQPNTSFMLRGGSAETMRVFQARFRVALHRLNRNPSFLGYVRATRRVRYHRAMVKAGAARGFRYGAHVFPNVHFVEAVERVACIFAGTRRFAVESPSLLQGRFTQTMRRSPSITSASRERGQFLCEAVALAWRASDRAADRTCRVTLCA